MSATRSPASPLEDDELDPTYSIVIPVYGNEGSLPRLLERLEVIAQRLDERLEVVFVVDGSPDRSYDLLVEFLPRTELKAQVLRHSRNFGSFAAIRTGLAAARGCYIAAMAADLQEPAELVEEFFARLRAGDCDVAVGRRMSRHDPGFTALMSNFFWSTFRRFVHPDIPPGGVDIFGATREVAKRLVTLEESHSSLIGLLYWVGYRRTEVPYERLPRLEGSSGWSFKRKFRYMLDSLFSFTDVPILVLVAIGVVGTVGSFFGSIALLVLYAFGVIEEPGYTPIMLAILFATSSILFGLGIVGSYVWRTYENSKGRPSSVVMSQQTFGPTDASSR